MKKFWLGLAVGALVAGVAVTLLAPQTGKSARRKIRRGLEDLGDNLSDAADYLKEQAERLAKEAQALVDSGQAQLGTQRRSDLGSRLAETAEAAQDYARSAGSRMKDLTSRLM